MRSRYSAYVLRNAKYLQETWDSTKRPEAIDFSREKITWLRLEITDIKKGSAKDTKGIVAFKAFYSEDGEGCVMNEISRFNKRSGRWYYLDGVIKSMGKIDMRTNQGKNAPCACGSGKKFKRCCGVEIMG
jgi:SEC-C motif-containing protein